MMPFHVLRWLENGGKTVSAIRSVKEFEEHTERLKKMYVNLSLEQYSSWSGKPKDGSILTRTDTKNVAYYPSGTFF